MSVELLRWWILARLDSNRFGDIRLFNRTFDHIRSSSIEFDRIFDFGDRIRATRSNSIELDLIRSGSINSILAITIHWRFGIWKLTIYTNCWIFCFLRSVPVVWWRKLSDLRVFTSVCFPIFHYVPLAIVEPLLHPSCCFDTLYTYSWYG